MGGYGYGGGSSGGSLPMVQGKGSDESTGDLGKTIQVGSGLKGMADKAGITGSVFPTTSAAGYESAQTAGGKAAMEASLAGTSQAAGATAAGATAAGVSSAGASSAAAGTVSSSAASAAAASSAASSSSAALSALAFYGGETVNMWKNAAKINVIGGSNGIKLGEDKGFYSNVFIPRKKI